MGNVTGRGLMECRGPDKAHRSISPEPQILARLMRDSKLQTFFVLRGGLGFEFVDHLCISRFVRNSVGFQSPELPSGDSRAGRSGIRTL